MLFCYIPDDAKIPTNMKQKRQIPMKKSFCKVPRPMLAGVVREQSCATAIAAIRNCEYQGATGIDLHLSCLDDEFRTVACIRDIVNASRLPVLALNYNISYDKGIYEAGEDERTELLLTAVEAGVAAVDIQGYTFDLYSKNNFRKEYSYLNYSFLKGNPKEVVVDDETIGKQTEFIERIHHMGAEVLLSNHTGIPMTTEQVVDLALFVEKRKPDIIKIVTPADTEEEMLEAFKAMTVLKKEVKTPVSYHCNGKKGGLTRIVNPVLGGFMCFCNERYTHNSDTGQPLLETAKTIFDNISKVV